MCRYTHPEGRAGFSTPEQGHSFREAAYAFAGMASLLLGSSKLRLPAAVRVVHVGGRDLVLSLTKAATLQCMAPFMQ